MRGLEGQGHLLWALEAGPAEPCPGAAEHLELRGRSTPGAFRAARPAWLRGPDKAALRRSCPARELARGLPDAGTGIRPPPPPRLDRGTGAGTGFLTLPHLASRSPASALEGVMGALAPERQESWLAERTFSVPGPVLRFDEPHLS